MNYKYDYDGIFTPISKNSFKPVFFFQIFWFSFKVYLVYEYEIYSGVELFSKLN